MQSISSAAPQSHIPPRIPLRRTLLTFIIDHNPCYLLSGALMLFGCFLLNSALYTKAGDIRKLLLLLLIINLYEVLLITLGLTLIKRIAFKNDGRILLGLQALFLVDITFTTGIIATIDLVWGLVINLVILALAAVKTHVILRGLRLPGAGKMTIFILAQVFLLLMVPSYFKWIAIPTGHIHALDVFFTWWLAALLPLLGLFLHRFPSRRLLDPPGVDRGVGVLFLLLPFGSLLVHLYSAGWVYSIDFVAPFAAPVLLGLAVAANLLETPRLQRYLIARLQVFMIAAAIYLSLSFPANLGFAFADIHFTPLRLTLLASALILLHFIWHHDRIGFLVASLLCLCAALLGPTAALIWHNLVQLLTSTRRLVPTTTLQWGILSISGAFGLLAAGALLSLRKHTELHRAIELIPERPLE